MQFRRKNVGKKYMAWNFAISDGMQSRRKVVGGKTYGLKFCNQRRKAISTKKCPEKYMSRNFKISDGMQSRRKKCREKYMSRNFITSDGLFFNEKISRKALRRNKTERQKNHNLGCDLNWKFQEKYKMLQRLERNVISKNKFQVKKCYAWKCQYNFCLKIAISAMSTKNWQVFKRLSINNKGQKTLSKYLIIQKMNNIATKIIATICKRIK